MEDPALALLQDNLIPEERKEISDKENEDKENEEIKPQKSEPENTSWGSWGSWLSSATTMVQNSVETYVKPTVSSIKQNTTSLVRELVLDEPNEPVKLYKTDEEETKDNVEPKKMEKPPMKLPDEDESNIEKPTQKSPTEGAQEDFFSVVDKGFTMIGDSVDILGNYFSIGYEKVANSDLTNKAKQSIEKAKQIASTTTPDKMLSAGERLAHQSVDALEAVGKRAFGFLTIQETEGETSRIRPVLFEGAPRSQVMKREQTFQESLEKNYFEDYNGIAHLQALENVSIECTLKVQRLHQKLSEQQVKEMNEFLIKVREVFDDEEGKASEEITLPSIDLSQHANKTKENLIILQKEALQIALEIVEQYKKDLDQLTPESRIVPTIISNLTISCLDKLLLECIQHLAHHSASGVELLLRIVESYMQSDSKPDKEQALIKATYIWKTAQILINELSILSDKFAQAMHAVVDHGKIFIQKIDVNTEDHIALVNQSLEEITGKIEIHLSHVALDTSNAISNIQDCKKFLFPVSKSLMIKEEQQ